MSADLDSDKAAGDQAPLAAADGGAADEAAPADSVADAGDTAVSSEGPAAPADRILSDPQETGRLVDMMLDDDAELAKSLEFCELDRIRLIAIAEENKVEISRAATTESEAVARAEVLEESAVRLEFRPRQLKVTRFLPSVLVALIIAGAAAGLSVTAAFTHLLGQAAWLQIPAATVTGTGLLVAGLRRAVDWINAASAERAATRNQRLDVAGAKARLDAARQALDRALIARGLRPAVLAVREQRVTPVYRTGLHYVSARGLSEVYNAARFEVSTWGFGQIREFLDSTPGGSIGLAGSRGTGKSTVIESFVAGRSRRTDGRRGLSVSVSAPVDYEPRDFLLHLFAEVCRAVFITEPSPGLYEAELALRMRRSTTRVQGLIKATASSVLAVVATLVLLSSRHYVTISAQAWAGYALLAASTAVGVWAVVSPGRAGRAESAEYRRLEGGTAFPGYGRGIPELAASNLAMIKFQQTYTTGWSGSLTATAGPVSGQAGLTGGTSYQQNVLTLPDLVGKFQDFITQVTPVGPVIIGIDELDKIQSADRAQAFLNDIKLIFGVAQCYFLISISEEALAGFERRGLPIRDAFDSALDDVATLTPLDYVTARDLIRGRAVGLGEPYVALAYCLAGGLPRDMIRWTRAIVQAGEPDCALSGLTGHIIGDDLQRKVHASVIALSDRGALEADPMLQYLGGLTASADPAWLLARCQEQLGQSAAPSAPPSWLALLVPSLRADPAAGDSEASGAVRKLVTELFGYFYFCATVLEVFTDNLDEASFRQLADGGGDGSFGQLAHARHLFGTDCRLALAQITAFRVARGLHGILPGWPVPQPRLPIPGQPQAAPAAQAPPAAPDPPAAHGLLAVADGDHGGDGQASV